MSACRSRGCNVCSECGGCCRVDCPDEDLCSCEGDYDADELGLDPEEDVERSLNERAAELLLRRPMYPGEIVN